MKPEFATDTMGLVLRLERRRLPQRVRQIFEKIEHGEGTLSIPAMVLAEIGYLSERGRIDTSLQEALSYCATYPTVTVASLSEEILVQSFEIDDIPELHDRLIAGTAATIKIPLISNDPVITRSQHLTVIWK